MFREYGWESGRSFRSFSMDQSDDQVSRSGVRKQTHMTTKYIERLVKIGQKIKMSGS